jgi:hypothetical protein
MKLKIIMIIWLFTGVCLDALTFTNWKEITDGIENEKLVDMVITDNILLADENNAYRFSKEEETWEKVFFINGEEKITGITGSEGKIFISTKHKVYTGEANKRNFQEIFALSKDDEIRTIELSALRRYLYAGTRKGLWSISLNGDGEKKFYKEINNVITLKAHPFDPDELFAGTEDGLYKVSKKYIRLLYTSLSKMSAKVNSIAISKANDDILYIATDNGLLRIRVRDKEFREIQLSEKILYAGTFETKPERIVALGERDIIFSEDGLKKWKTLSGVIPHGRGVKILLSPDGKVYLLTDSGVFVSEENSFSSLSIQEIEQTFQSEPTFEEMERVVLKAYLLDKNIIKRWRRHSRLKALLPDVDIGVSAGFDLDFDRDVKDTIYTSSSSGRYYIGPDERKLSESYGRDINYGIKLTWKLGDTVFNRDELSVSNEAEDMLDFRYRVLSDLRRVYFERRRLIAELNMLTQDDDYKKFELKNRIEELTAYLDMLSDGYFSKNIKSKTTH